MTNNFSRLLGEGGFGKVYYGVMGNTEVAVKMLSPKSTQGYQEFQAEVLTQLLLAPLTLFLRLFRLLIRMLTHHRSIFF